MAFAKLLLAAVIGYLLGNIQTGLIVGWVTKKIDLRTQGSGSTGATNALRTLGVRSAAITFLGDLAKGILASVIGLAFAGKTGQLTGALFVVAGHIWPVFFHFHGGKGVATSIGALVLVHPLIACVAVVLAIILIALTKYVSLGSLTGMVIYAVWAGVLSVQEGDVFALIVSVLIPALVIFAHRANIGRLLRGKENTLNLHK